MSFRRSILIPILVIFILASSATYAKKAAIVIDFDTKEVLFEVNANTKNYPASLTKIMTLYILFDQIDKGFLPMKLNSKFQKLHLLDLQVNYTLRLGLT